MNFTKERDFTKPRVMKRGDLVIVYERHDSLDHFFIQANAIFNNKYGTFHHNDMIGKPFGSKINSKSSPGYVFLLEPTPELWSTAVHTRTQIVDELDSAVVTLNLDVHPGCTVVETGTGSGCMTMSLARAAYPNGHVFTFEYNGVRAQKARDEFQKLGVGNMITVTHRDVCGKYHNDEPTVPASTDATADAASTSSSAESKDAPASSAKTESGTETENAGEQTTYCNKPGGFPNVPTGGADAVFLDLPEPWLALEHVLRVLKPGRTMCSYSPCIEQVIKTCDKLRELKFHSIRMMEVRQRPYDARVVELETVDLGLSVEGEALNNRSARDRDNTHQKTKPRDDFVPVFEPRSAEEGNAGDEGADSDDGREETEQNEQVEEKEGNGRDPSQAYKRRKIRFRAPASDAAVAAEGSNVQVYAQNDMTDAQFRTLQNRIKNRPVSAVNGSYEMHISRPIAGMKGHTAFLTFAVAPLAR